MSSEHVRVRFSDREATKIIREVLQPDLYKRIPDPAPDFGMTWQSPLGWTVRISGDPVLPEVTIWQPGKAFTAEVFWRADRATVDDVAAVIP